MSLVEIILILVVAGLIMWMINTYIPMDGKIKQILNVVVVIAVNAAFMLISPRAWFRLPEWFPGRGSMTEHKYGNGWGAVETRIAGGMILAVILWALYDALLRPR